MARRLTSAPSPNGSAGVGTIEQWVPVYFAAVIVISIALLIWNIL